MLRRRKNAIAAFGYSWIRPAGCSKTMLGIREEAAEREAIERAQLFPPDVLEVPQPVFDMEGAMQMDVDNDGGAGAGVDEEGEYNDGDDQMGMERDLDEDIPEMAGDDYSDEDAGYERYGDDDSDRIYEDEDAEGDENEAPEEEGTGLFERDLDDDIPDADEGFTDMNGEESTIHEDDTYNSNQMENSIAQEQEDVDHDLDDDIPDASERSDDESENEGIYSEEEEQQQESKEPSYLDADNKFTQPTMPPATQPANPMTTTPPIPVNTSPYRQSSHRSTSRDLFQTHPTLQSSFPRPVPPYNSHMNADDSMDTAQEEMSANSESELNIEHCSNINVRRPRGGHGQDTPVRNNDALENSDRPSFVTPLSAVTPSETPGTGITLRRAAARRAAQQTRAHLGLQDAVSMRSRRKPRAVSQNPDSNQNTNTEPDSNRDPVTLQTPAHNSTASTEMTRQSVASTPVNDVPLSARTRSRGRSQAHLVTPDIGNIPIAPSAPARKGTRRLRGRK